MTVAAELVRRGAERFGTRTAVVFEDRSLTYREVDDATNQFAGVLASRTIGKGDRVGIKEPVNINTVFISFR